MDPISIFAAVPKIALFFLLIVGGAIVAEIFYFGRKKETKIEKVALPPTSPTPETPLETIPPSPPSQPPPSPSPPPRKPRLSRKTLTALLIVFFLAASVPAAVILVEQRQEMRERAVECDIDCESVTDEAACWSNAGSGCKWQPYGGNRPHWEGECICGRNPPPTPPPEPTSPPEGCSNKGESCGSGCCGNLVCDFGTCKSCSDFGGDEARCWTHEKCYFINGSCQDRPAETPPPGTGDITCSGSSVKNDTNQTLNCAASYFTCKVPKSSRAECEADPFCGGSSSSTSFTLGPGVSKSFPDSSGIRCGVWQNDFTVDCGGGYSCSGGDHGCNWDETCEATPTPTSTPTPTPSPTPTPPPEHTAQCEFCKVYDESWNEITDLSTLTVGQTIYFATRGVTSHPEGITKARFRINGEMWQETTDKHGTDEFYIQFTIPAAGSYTIESMVYNPTLGWW